MTIEDGMADEEADPKKKRTMRRRTVPRRNADEEAILPKSKKKCMKEQPSLFSGEELSEEFKDKASCCF